MSFDNLLKTPCYIVDAQKATELYKNFNDLIRQNGREDIVAYSVKANYNPSILCALNQLKSYFEVCSEYEYRMLIDIGVPEDKIFISNCAAFCHDYARAGSVVILDSIEQMEQWCCKKPDQQFGIRLNLNDVTTDDRFTNKTSRFGIDISSNKFRFLINKREIRNNLVGLQCSLSGNSRDPSVYSDIVNRLKMIENELELDNLKYIDIGGGYKTGYKYWTFSDYIKTIYIENNLYNYKPKIVFEPGNSLVKDAGYYCTKVIAKKELYGEDVVIVDGSTMHLPKGYLKSCEYDIVQDNYTNITSRIQKVCGATCKESDIFFRLQDTARLSIGDIIVFKQIGAYSMYDIGTRILGPMKIYEGSIDNYVGTKKYKNIVSGL